MIISESLCLHCELTAAEARKLRAIAKRDGITLEEALAKAVKNFLVVGVQTPDKRGCAHAA